MKKSTRFLGIAAVGFAALLLPLNAHAVCGTTLSFGGYYSYLTGTTERSFPAFQLLDLEQRERGHRSRNGQWHGG